MSTEMEVARTPQQPRMLTYMQLFSTKESTRVQVKRAATRLGYMTGKVLEPMLLEGWAQNLETYSPSQLQAAFERVEGEGAAFPAVAHIKAILDRAEFDAALVLVLKGMARHKYWEWLDRKEYKESDSWDFHSAEAIALGDRIKVIGKTHPAEPAPTIPPRMLKALELFGQEGDFHMGLKRLWRDSPVFWTGDTERNPGDHGRIADQIDRSLFDCWKRAL